VTEVRKRAVNMPIGGKDNLGDEDAGKGPFGLK
jgi:hypothetical protein